jgi:dihydrofolate reductase
MTKSNKPILSIVVAMNQKGLIGQEGRLPWRLPEDLKHFKKITMGHPVIMGRKTFASIGRPLPGRTNILLSRQPHFAAAGMETCHSLAEALDFARQSPGGQEECFIIGGAEIYALAYDLVDRIYVTEVDDPTKPGDAWFPVPTWRRDFEILTETPGQEPAEATYLFLLGQRRKRSGTVC